MGLHLVGTVPTFNLHLVGTVPTFNLHNLVGTVPTFNLHLVGTVPTFNLHLVGRAGVKYENFSNHSPHLVGCHTHKKMMLGEN